MDVINKTKRASVSFGQPRIVDDDAKAKLKYQTLLNDYLELQKAYVSSKRKLQTAKQKKETLLSEVRFLRRKRKYLLKSNSSNGGRHHHITSEAAPENFDQVFVSSSSSKNKEARGNKPVNEDEDIKLTKKLKNGIIHDKGKRKISWPDHVTLKV